MTPIALLVLLFTSPTLAFTFGPLPESPAQPARAGEDEQTTRIRELLRDFEFGQKNYRLLVQMGSKAFPSYEAILADPKSDPDSVGRIFIVLESVDADRSRFVEPAVRWLVNPEWEARLFVARCLGKIGSSRDAAPVVALLGDENPEVAATAAKTLVAIGDQRVLAALEIWINSGRNRDNEVLRKHVIKCRDELKQRLEKAKKPAK